jgi:hypothetical protein
VVASTRGAEAVARNYQSALRQRDSGFVVAEEVSDSAKYAWSYEIQNPKSKIQNRMSIWEIFSLTLLKFSVGTWIIVLALWSREIRRSFYVFNAAMSAGLVTLVLMTDIFALKRTDLEHLSGLIFFIVCSVVASALHRLEKHSLARALGTLATVVGIVSLVKQAWTPVVVADMTTTARWLVGIGFVSGAILLGASHVTMLLGHWYLVMHQLSFEHLRRFTLAFAGAIVLQAVVCAVIVIGFTNLGTAEQLWAQKLLSLDKNGLFFAMRVVGGIVLPAALAYMSYRCVQLKANQAATGLLYLAEVAVLFGEVFASYLLV